MVNRRTKRKNAVVAVTGASETVQGRGFVRRAVVGVGPSPFVLTGPTTVREQLTAMRGASNSGSSRFFNGQFNLSNRCNLVTSSVAQTNRLNRCYFSRGAINNCDMSASSLMSHKVNINSVSVSLTVPSYSFLNNESHNQQQFNGASASCVIMKPAAVKPQTHPTHKPQPVDANRVLMPPRIYFASEECEADKEVALINSSNMSNMAVATNATSTKHSCYKKKKMTRISPRVSKLPYRKTRQSPRFILSPADTSSMKNCQNKNLNNSNLVKNSMLNEAAKVEPKRSCLDVLLERQKRLQKIVVTLKRKPRPFTNLRRAIEKARKVKGVTGHDHQENPILRGEVKCSTPKNIDMPVVASSNDNILLESPSSVDSSFLKETERAVKSIGQRMSPIAPLSNLDPEDSFEDLIPEEFMIDESEILGISLDNISAFGDSYADLDFDEETRSSFPELSDNTPNANENSDNLGTYAICELDGNDECIGNENENLFEPSTMPFQPQLGAIQPSSQKSDKCFGSKIGAQSPPLVLSNNLNNNSQQVPINAVNVLQPELSPNDGFHWLATSYSSEWKNDSIDKFMAPIGANSALGTFHVAVPSTEKGVFTRAITFDAKQNYESVLPKSLKEPIHSKSRSAPLRNLISALSPIQSMSCSTASARIDSPLLLTASPSEELSPLS